MILRSRPSGLRPYVIRFVDTNVSEERTVSILTFDPEDGGNVSFRKVRIHLQDYTLL
jgi:hypothetical protein